jgi:hypothetical protein
LILLLDKENKSDILKELKKIMEAENGSDFQLTEEEQDKLMKLAEVLTDIDYSNESEIKDILRKKLLSKDFECELEDDELDYAAGGIKPLWEDSENIDE